MELEIYMFRHKERKDLFLHFVSICTPIDEIYASVTEIIENVDVFFDNNKLKLVEEWKDKNPDKEFVFKEFRSYNRDGWTGELKKITKLYLKDFEKVTLKEV